MNKIVFSASLLFCVIFSHQTSAQQKNILLFIGDGMGPSVLGAARIYNKELYFDKLPHTAIVQTHSFDAHVTDSAASATAFAIGKKAFNKAVGVSAEEQKSGVISKKNTSLAHIAKAKGMSVAIITDSTVTDATPGAFYAKTTDRSEDSVIMEQLFEAPVDLVIGGGQTTYEKIKSKNKKFKYISSSKDYFALKKLTQPHLVLLTPDIFPYYATSARKKEFPTLGSLVIKAIELLGSNPKGYFIAIEGGLIDKALHANETDSAMLHVQELQAAVKDIDAKTDDRKTLIVVTADHDTSGMSVNGYDTKDTKIGDQLERYGVKYPFVTYTSGPKGLVKMEKGVHTGVDIHLFAKGYKSHQFRGTLHHVDVYNKIKSVIVNK